MVIAVVMGVAGSGKSTIGRAVADQLGADFLEGDKFHPEANIAKMSRGEPLTDADRWPWLEAIARHIDNVRKAGGHSVIACSALKRAYRDILIGDRPDVRLIYLKGEHDLIMRRLAVRHDHFMPPQLLDSQFAALEEPGVAERPITVSIAPRPREIVGEILSRLDITEP